MIVLGIDPGRKGGFAVLDTADSRIVVAKPIPHHPGERIMDVEALQAEIDAHAGLPDLVVLEEVHSTPRDGHVGAFTFGMGFGALLTLCALSGWNAPHLVAPGTWQFYVIPGNKNDVNNPNATKLASVAFAQKTYPEVELIQPRCRKPHDGVSDAICLAHYGAHHVKSL